MQKNTFFLQQTYTLLTSHPPQNTLFFFFLFPLRSGWVHAARVYGSVYATIRWVADGLVAAPWSSRAKHQNALQFRVFQPSPRGWYLGWGCAGTICNRQNGTICNRQNGTICNRQNGTICNRQNVLSVISHSEIFTTIFHCECSLEDL